MATIYGQDTSMILKALSESLHLNPVSPSQASKKKRLKKSQLTELTKTAQPRPDDLEQSQSLLSWFSGLSISLRLQVLSLHNSLLATFVRQMYIKKLTEGDYEFKLMSNIARQVDQDLLEENFFFRRNNFEGYSYSDTKLYSEKNFEQMLRFKDTEEYLDTITVDPDVARNPASLIEMMRNITNQRVFEVPCRSYWDPACKKWMWEYPHWFDAQRHNSLAAWACAGLERVIWMNFFVLTSRDPRKTGETLNFIPDENLHDSNIQFQESLVTFWTELSEQRRLEIIGDMDELNKTFQTVKTETINLSKRQINTWAYPMFRVSCFNPISTGILSYCSPLISQHQTAARTRIQFFQTNKSVELIIQRLKNDHSAKFLEFLACSPVDRAVSYLDIVARRALLRIKSAFTEKNAEDLISEVIKTNEIKIEKKKEEIKKKKKKKKPNKSKINTSHKQSEEANELVVKNLMENVMKNLYENFKAEEIQEIAVREEVIEENKPQEIVSEGFQTVEINKRNKRRPQPQQKNKKYPHKAPNFHPRMQNSLTQTPKNENKRGKPKETFHWQSSKATPLDATISNDNDFPPLIPSLTPIIQTSRLHQEIIKFNSEMVAKVSFKYPVISLIINKLNTCAVSLFSNASVDLFGSYGSGLALADSDVDLAITGTCFYDRKSLQRACINLGELLELLPWIRSCKKISTATIPVIKLEIDLVFFGQNSEIILIDITFDDSAPDKSGTHLGKATLDLTKDLMVLYPHLQYIALVIKQLLYSHNLNSAYLGIFYLGGLSSYSLNLWIAAFMNSISQVSQDLGEVLLQFLDFYGNSFNSDTTGISILNGGSFYSLPKLHYEPIVTIDPINHSNNTTRTSYRVKDVLRLFSETHAKLIELKDKKRKDLLKQIFRAS